MIGLENMFMQLAAINQYSVNNYVTYDRFLDPFHITWWLTVSKAYLINAMTLIFYKNEHSNRICDKNHPKLLKRHCGSSKMNSQSTCDSLQILKFLILFSKSLD